MSTPRLAEADPATRVVARWLASPEAGCFVGHARYPREGGRAAPLPAGVGADLARALREQGVTGLYRHQARAIAALDAGEDVVVATPTASGKSLCYTLPILRDAIADPGARALCLYPTKALARDQVDALRRLASAAGAPVGVAAYDGDTPPDHRRAARRRASVICTNPEMLHAGVIPHHPSWARLLAGLRYVVVDELHTYRGVFGSHVAHVLRRLLRVAAFHGARPRVVATSATIANPGELLAALTGRPARVVLESTAPRGERHLLLYNPPLLDAATGLRRSHLEAACRLTRDLARAGLGTLLFCRTRLAVEVAVRRLRELLAPRGPEEASVAAPPEVLVRGYRGGYLPGRRREVEAALRAGETRVVVATSALELGIDVGGLDAVVMAGWPGSRAATWQRAGRAGRRRRTSLAILVAASGPLDQHVANDPGYLFGQRPEHARVAPENPAILVPHIKCAAHELPFAPEEAYPPASREETRAVLDCLAEAGQLHESGGAYHYVGDGFPAAGVSLRGPADENYLVVRDPGGEVLAEVSYDDAPRELHEQAIYQLEGRQYQVLRLDHETRRAHVVAVEVDYFTDAVTQTRVRILESIERAGAAAWGEVHVATRVIGFKKIKVHTRENAGYGDVSQPERELHTTACWFALPAERVAALGAGPGELAEAAEGAALALHATAALLTMCDLGDLGRAAGDARSTWHGVGGGRARRPTLGVDAPAGGAIFAPTLFLFDRYPGGTGLAERIYDLRARVVAEARRAIGRCACERGCPACVGPGARPETKALASRLLDVAAAALNDSGPPPAGTTPSPEAPR